MPTSEQFFGGAPRFGPQNTFLGAKVEANLVASRPATAMVQQEDVLGSSERARYTTLLDRVKSGRLPVATKPVDMLSASSALVAPKAAAALDRLPDGFTMPENIREGLRDAAKFDKNAAKLMEEYFGYKPGQQSIPMTSGRGKDVRTPLGNDIVGVANGFIGVNNYKYGAWDCSAFTQRVVKDATGIDISRSTATQIGWFQKQGLWSKDIKQARPGDVIYMRSGASPSGRHTGIYIGNGLMVDNAGSGKPIKVRSIAGHELIGFGLATGLK